MDLEALELAGDGVALARVGVPARVVDDAELAATLRESQIRVVLAQLQPVLGARREHPIGLGHAARDEIVDEHAEIRLVAPRRPAFLAARVTRRVDAGEQPLRRGFLVSRRAVDLPGEEEAADRLGFERRLERARIEIIVFDGIAGTQDVRMLAARDRMHERELDVERQRRRDPVRIDLVRRETLGLEEDLVARALREAHDLVLDRRTVARADALDDAGEQRRAIEAAANDLVRALVGVRDPARHLRRMHLARADEAHHRRGLVAGLPFERREIDGAPVETRRCSGLESSGGQRELAQSRAERLRRRIACAPRLVMLEADMNQSGQERAGGQHHGVRLEGHAHLRHHAGHGRCPCRCRRTVEVIDRPAGTT